ncbi:hypothetical protein D3C87_217900 [compost metagenome]
MKENHNDRMNIVRNANMWFFFICGMGFLVLNHLLEHYRFHSLSNGDFLQLMLLQYFP